MKASHRLFMKDFNSSKRFLIDTGADISIIPARAFHEFKQPDSRFLYAANATPSEMIYGTTLRFPGLFFDSSNTNPTNDSNFIKDFKRIMEDLQPVQTSHHNNHKIFIQKELTDCSHVFVRDDTVRAPLKPPYDGPFEVISKNDKSFILNIKNKHKSISIDRLKAAYIFNDNFQSIDSINNLNSFIQISQKKNVQFKL